MQITTKLSRSELDAIAANLGMELRNTRRGTDNGTDVLLRPGPTMKERYRVIGSGGRRVYAVTWAGHYGFMAGVFTRDPNASIHSTLAHWRDAEHFFAEAETPPIRHGHETVSPMNWAPAR